MIGMPCTFDAGQHAVIHPELEDWIHREIPDRNFLDRVFVYRHLLYGTFVIAQWLNRDAGLFIDVMNLGYSLGNFDKEKARTLRSNIMQPITGRQARDCMRKAQDDHVERRQEADQLERGKRGRLKKDHGIDSPYHTVGA